MCNIYDVPYKTKHCAISFRLAKLKLRNHKYCSKNKIIQGQIWRGKLVYMFTTFLMQIPQLHELQSPENHKYCSINKTISHLS